MKILKNNNEIIQGARSTTGDGLWNIPLPSPTPTINNVHNCSLPHPSINVIIRKSTTAKDLALYLHATCFSPTKDTFLKAIKNNHFIGWPGLTATLIQKHLTPTIASIKGHLKQEKQGLQSTSTKLPFPSFSDEDMNPPSDIPNIKTHDVILSITSKSDKAFMDLTGRFPHCSSRGNEYILIIYHYDSNAILGLPLKNRQASTITTAWQELNATLQQAGVTPNTWILDNEVSQELKTALTKNKTSYQLVPPYTHRANAAERAIQTFKAHFTAGLASVDPDYPVSEWDRLLHQSFITLNLLRTARVNPKLSAYAYLFGNFNFNATPMAPPGTKTVVHIKPEKRPTWGSRGKEGWYIGPSLHHYRCVKCYLPLTRAEIDADTVTFIPKTIHFPEVTISDFLKQAATDIITLLKHPPHPTIPSLAAGDDVNNAIFILASLLNRTNNTNYLLDKAYQHQKQLTQKPLQPPLPQPPILPKPVIPYTSTYIPPLPRVLQNQPSLPSQLTRVPYFQPHSHSLPFHHPFRNLPAINHMYDISGRRQSLDKLLQGENKHIWQQSASNEFGRLAQGNTSGIVGTNTIEFIPPHHLPPQALVTYASFVCDYKPHKAEKYRVRMVVGGDKLIYNDDAGAPAASLLETKILINSVISDSHKGSKFMTCDLKDFYLATPMSKPEYMKIPLHYIPQDIITQYNLHSLKSKSNQVYIKIKKGMYGLKQAAILAYENLITNLKPYGYEPIPNTVGLWKHHTRDITFCLCVDDFGIKYFHQQDADHLLNSLRNNYKLSIDWTGSQFCGLHLHWNYPLKHVDISMPSYIPNLLHKLNYNPNIPQYSPFPALPFTPSQPGQRQYAPPPDTSPPLGPKLTTRVQSIIGSLLYYARAVDCTLLPALNTLSTQQASPTEQTLRLCHRLLDYAATYPNVKLRFHSNDMVLTINSDAAYLVAPKARSRVAGHFTLGSSPCPTSLSGPILVECRTLRHVVASSAEAEVAGVFHNAQIAIPIRYTLESLGHPQPPTVIKTDNTTAVSFTSDNITQKRSKSWDMRFYWLRDKASQKHFKIIWERAAKNLADYFTKHFTAKYHKHIRNKYVVNNTNALPNCKGVLVRDICHSLPVTSELMTHKKNPKTDYLFY